MCWSRNLSRLRHVSSRVCHGCVPLKSRKRTVTFVQCARTSRKRPVVVPVESRLGHECVPLWSCNLSRLRPGCVTGASRSCPAQVPKRTVTFVQCARTSRKRPVVVPVGSHVRPVVVPWWSRMACVTVPICPVQSRPGHAQVPSDPSTGPIRVTKCHFVTRSGLLCWSQWQQLAASSRLHMTRAR